MITIIIIDAVLIMADFTLISRLIFFIFTKERIKNAL